MNVQETVLSTRMQGWLQQVQDCQQSGLSVPEWCSNNGINTKTYYNRRKRVREELLGNTVPGEALALSSRRPGKLDMPVFAAMPVPKFKSQTVAAAVRIGTYIAEINNGADLETVDGVLRTLSRL